MKSFAINIILAMAWCAITFDASGWNMVLALALGAAAGAMAAPLLGEVFYLQRVAWAFYLLLYFLFELALSNVRVARDVIWPRFHFKPGIVAVPLRVKSDLGITLLANMITLTPGTMSLGVSPDRQFLYVHAMDMGDAEEMKAGLAAGFERLIIKAVE